MMNLVLAKSESEVRFIYQYCGFHHESLVFMGWKTDPIKKTTHSAWSGL
ncbi:hypothetical protein F941_00780 [Acinetobacter bouvetii DSM 14964 = CIP 107468]|uniref:Uncharacterized protein n=1 Tax=Acinetobacter bouvetii DSM 14964 = CIP 107468 TaxID=1120925 RepID=N9DLZ7_9GAMM|nr:hypothetical protein F941_00780 [Acinetobacter bouvetii DSM 14964 = CIP 107468]